MTDAELQAFQGAVWRYYELHGRHNLPWRLPEADGAFDPYKILVSEVMLQQTQVPRVIPKYQAFLQQFPDWQALAAAPLGDVLLAWSGLGYNRRAKFLWQAAQQVAGRYGGQLPQTIAELKELPGIGTNTAGAIVAYAFNWPVGFVETNIRTVFIHHFFSGRQDIHDHEILEAIQRTLPTENIREWYWALMDYGSFLKQTVGNLNKLSKNYAKQPAFQGSRRQLRGQILRLLGTGPQSTEQLAELLADERLGSVLSDLTQEMMIRKVGDTYTLH